MCPFRAAIAAACLSISTAAAAAPATYSMTVEWPPGYERSAILNERGQMAGDIWRFYAGQEGPTLRAYLLSEGEYIDLGLLLSATGLNNLGHVTLRGIGDNSQHGRAYLYQSGRTRDLGTLGGSTATPTGINDAGQVVGYSSVAGDIGHRAFIYQDGTMRALGIDPGRSSSAADINNHGQIAGEYVDAQARSRAFVLDENGFRDLGTLGGNTATAMRISEAGHVVGLSEDVRGAMHGYIYHDGIMTALPDVDGKPFEAVDVNSAGQVISADYLWSDGQLRAARDLAATGPDWELHYLYSMNEHGQISAHGCRFDATCAILLLTPVPEPSTVAMYLGGLALLAVTLRRRSPPAVSASGSRHLEETSLPPDCNASVR